MTQKLWSDKTTLEEFQTRQIMIDEPIFQEDGEDKITYVQRSQCRTTHKRKDC
ncbi:hypothetical protein M2R47_02435 [Moraxella sp. Tifton1]|uniref:hypothetical protein n=1 Tax=Moraxella oculi TaxID=2940516 RepID=UPI002013763C|nr:hypothetical protein [Moraxella sp. Tifton1]MCL1623112.1 hypothetical protein [Moraxella sp. Tifton1]